MKERKVISVSSRKGTMMVIDVETIPNKKNRLGKPYKVSTTKHVKIDKSLLKGE
tara:strand:- start:15655 stop:15816 length:162 start_codon:yes stop_codon:yes gene_type:complete